MTRSTSGMSNTWLSICDYLCLPLCRRINATCRRISLSFSGGPLNLNLPSWLVNLSVAHLEAERLIRGRTNRPQYSTATETITKCIVVGADCPASMTRGDGWISMMRSPYVIMCIGSEPLNVSRMAVATHECRIIRVTYGRCGCGSLIR
jgi:hypothetical protein